MELVAVNGVLAGTAYVLAQGLIIPSPDDASPGQRGCRIRAVDAGEFTLEAVDGDMSLFVNGLPLSGRPLRTGDEVRLGDSLFIARAHERVPTTVLDACPVSLGRLAKTRKVLEMSFDDAVLYAAGVDGLRDCSRSASRRSASLHSVLPDVTAPRPSATLRSNNCARSDRCASLDAASRITAANFSMTDWMRGRATSGQASAEPIIGPTRPARSRTRSILSPGAASAAVMKKALSKNEVQRRFTKIRTTQLLG